MTDPISLLEQARKAARSWIAEPDDPREILRRAARFFDATVKLKAFASEMRALTVAVIRQARHDDMAQRQQRYTQRQMAEDLGVNPQRVNQLRVEGEALAKREDQP